MTETRVEARRARERDDVSSGARTERLGAGVRARARTRRLTDDEARARVDDRR